MSVRPSMAKRWFTLGVSQIVSIISNTVVAWLLKWVVLQRLFWISTGFASFGAEDEININIISKNLTKYKK